MEAADLRFEDIAIGAIASFKRTITADDVTTFANLSGDLNPLHIDEVYAGASKFKERLVHGALLGSLFSALVGMHLPGKRCLYLGQTLVFKKPVFVGSTVVVQGTVQSKVEATRMLTIQTTITNADEVAVSGIATVQVLS